MDFARNLKKNYEYECENITSNNWCPWNGFQSPEKYFGRNEDQTKIRDHPVHCTVKISSNTWKSHGDLRRLAVTPKKVNNLQLKVISKKKNELI